MSEQEQEVFELATLRGRIRINPNALDRELIDQPELVYHAAEGYALARSRSDRLKDEVKILEARLAASFRGEERDDGGRVTDKAVREYTASHEEMVALQKRILRSIRRLDHWFAVQEAIRSKGYMLRELVSLHNAQYYSPDHVSGPKVEEASTNRAAEVVRSVRRRERLEGVGRGTRGSKKKS